MGSALSVRDRALLHPTGEVFVCWLTGIWTSDLLVHDRGLVLRHVHRPDRRHLQRHPLRAPSKQSNRLCVTLPNTNVTFTRIRPDAGRPVVVIGPGSRSPRWVGLQSRTVYGMLRTVR